MTIVRVKRENRVAFTLALALALAGCGGNGPSSQTPPPPQCASSGFNNLTTVPDSSLTQLWAQAQAEVVQGTHATCNGQPCTVSDVRGSTIAPGCVTVTASASATSNPQSQVNTTTKPETVTIPLDLNPGAAEYDFVTVILFRLKYDISGRIPPAN